MGTTTVQAPLPGTFYHRSAPGQPPFKAPGDAVAPGDTLGLIEVMKTFTPVAAEAAGRFVRFLIDDGDAVMAGEPLYELET